LKNVVIQKKASHTVLYLPKGGTPVFSLKIKVQRPQISDFAVDVLDELDRVTTENFGIDT
jgi:hypothetical protein